MPKTTTNKHAATFRFMQIHFDCLCILAEHQLKPHEYSHSNSGPGRLGILVPKTETKNPTIGRSAESNICQILLTTPAVSRMCSVCLPGLFSRQNMSGGQLGDIQMLVFPNNRSTQHNNYREKLFIIWWNKSQIWIATKT